MKNYFFLFVGLAFLVVLASCGCSTIAETTVNVQDKRVVTVQDDDDDDEDVYRVWTDQGIFDVEDKNLYDALAAGQKYKITYVGDRDDASSTFPSIVSAEWVVVSPTIK